MFAKGPVCQSCGMPLARDPQKGGSEADGSKSTVYCSHCYKNGSFTNPTIQLHEMIDLVENKLSQMWIPRFVARYFTKGLPKLQRWNKK